MTPQLAQGESMHLIGASTKGLLRDMGWELNDVIFFGIETDDYPTEVTISVLVDENLIFTIDSDYFPAPNTQYALTFFLPPNFCYDFLIEDEYGDGICCDFGDGSFGLASDCGVFYENNNWTSESDTYNFCLLTAPSSIGCGDVNACNYEPYIDFSDDSCYFTNDPCDDADYTTDNDVYNENCDCVGEPMIGGCNNPQACNWNSQAEYNNGSCIYPNDPCDDNDELTDNDIYNQDCDCVGTPISKVDELEALSVLIYPNPTSNNLTVDLGDLNGVNTTIKLYDSSSKLVFEKESTSTLMIDVSGFAKGMYSLELSTDEQARSQVIVE